MHTNKPVVGIVGLGLIGGSFAKALRKNTLFTILGYDADPLVLNDAISQGVIDSELSSQISKCDILILALYPKNAVDFIKDNAHLINPQTIVTDCGGIKKYICDEITPIAKVHGFTFIGAHPMAGIEQFGFEHSTANLFEGASLILTPSRDTPEEKVRFLWNILKEAGFAHLKLSTPKEHDQIIAYTSQLAHVVSSAYVQSPSSMMHYGFSAGSVKDMTRVAKLNEHMWTELFLENKNYLQDELESLIRRLCEFNTAIKNADKNQLLNLLKKGREIKEKSDLSGIKDK